MLASESNKGTMRYIALKIFAPLLCACLVGHCLAVRAQAGVSVTQQVLATERAFAKTMADRNQPQFSRFISAEAVFFSAENPLRGKSKVVEGWSKYFKTPQAPFSWEPSKVEVLESGTLALSTGPVTDPSGKLIGTFTSIWRLEAPHTWRIVFDKGNDVCNH